MQNNTNINITYSDEEENEDDENPIINNNDEFGMINEPSQKPNNKSICNINKLEHHRAKSKKINENFKINTPKTKFGGIPHMNLYSLLLQGDDNLSQDNKNKIKKCRIKQKKQNSKMKKYLDISKKNGKSVFIKISEDIYTKFKSKPNKEVRDINKMEEDAYNKMTSEPYIKTCENRENIKNRKIVQDFLDRKAKEDTFKKIRIECDKKDEMKKLQDPKRALSVTDRNINFKSTRTLAQFLQDQNQKNNLDRKKNKNNKKIPKPIKGNILPQDSTYIFPDNRNDDTFSEFSKNIEFFNDDNISMKYENESFLRNNDKFKESEEKEKVVNKTFEMEKELINPGVNFTLINKKNPKKKQENFIKEKSNKIYPKTKQNYKKNEKKEKNLKESSSTSTSKKSTENITKKFINLYKEKLLKILGQKFENEFDINFPAFLLILYNVGFTNKNYTTFLESSEIDLDKKSFHSKEISDFSISNSSLNMSEISDKKSGKFFKKDSAAGKSLEDEAEKYKDTFKYDKEFQLSKDGWKIITEKQNFDEEIGISSKKVFLFYISVLGLCKEEKSEKLLKKECPFFFGDKKLVQQFNNSNKYINKYFGLFKINAMDNLFMPEKKNKILISNTNSLISSFTISNLDNSSNTKKYDIYDKNYNNKNLIKNNNKIIDDDSNSIRLFNAGIQKEKQFYYDIKNKDKSSKSIISLTDIDHLENNSIYLLNNSISDNSSFWDLKKIFRENPIEKKGEDSEELDVNSFLLEDNNNYFQYGANKDKNNYNEIKSYVQDDVDNNNGKKNVEKKIIKYVFEIKIEDKPKKLIIRRGDDKNNIIKEFCKKYGLDDIERNKLLQVIDERLKNLNYNKIRNNK